MFASVVVVAGGVATYQLFKTFTQPSPCRPWYTLVDAPDSEATWTLVQRLCKTPFDSTDDLMERLARLYERFPPTERTLRRLSLQQQAAQGRGDAHEYSITLAYATATEHVLAAGKQNSNKSGRPRTRAIITQSAHPHARIRRHSSRARLRDVRRSTTSNFHSVPCKKRDGSFASTSGRRPCSLSTSSTSDDGFASEN